MSGSQRMRLDEALVAAGLAQSRARARDMVLRGVVTVDGVVADKPARGVAPEAQFHISDPLSGYVSRGGLKLMAGLDAFSFTPSGLAALDLGASTGGFTQVLLQRGAATVVAVDSGHGQLHPTIAADPRVRAHEGLNARDLKRAHLHGLSIGAVVADLSFISLKLALPSALSLAAPGAWGVFLVKPQFEVGRDAIGKGGIVREPDAALRAVASIAEWLSARPGWRVVGQIPSPIQGGDGNHEFLLGARRD